MKSLKKEQQLEKYVVPTCLAYLSHDGKLSLFIERKIKFLKLSRHILYPNFK